MRSKLLSKSLKPLHFGSLKRGSSCCHFKIFFFPPSVQAGDHKHRSIHFPLVRGLSSSLLFCGCLELLPGVFGIREEEEEEGRQEEEEEADCFENCGKCYDVLELFFLLFCLLMISVLSQLFLIAAVSAERS